MGAREKVLVVNDEPSIRKYLRTLLKVEGFDVATVNGGKQALAKIKAGERPDYIILDLLMPEMGGIETLEELMRLDRRDTLSPKSEIFQESHRLVCRPLPRTPSPARRCKNTFTKAETVP